ncbi:hypothetical protein IWW55_005123 [Coemansia sp. RSA 2706]|nr:hypothetical protein IWW55_005123 [Coemansia sp. RSA 2706]
MARVLAASLKKIIASEHLSKTISDLSGELSSPELERLARFRFKHDALRFVAGRTLVRRLISTDVQIIESIDGSKPTLASTTPDAADFNISHDGHWVLAGCTPTGIIGVDVAKVHCPPDLTTQEFVSEFPLSAWEQDYLATRSQNHLLDFYRLWTAKEAYTKAIGTGIATVDLRSVNVDLDCSKIQNAEIELSTGTLDSDDYVYCIATTPGIIPRVDIIEL